MGRSQEFDTTAVVAAALDVFWARGYEGASLGDLESATGLSRSSLYNSFTNKRGLFDAAVQLYLDHVIRPRLRSLTTKSRGRRRRRLPFLACARDRHHDRRLTSARLPTSQYGCRTRRARRCGGRSDPRVPPRARRRDQQWITRRVSNRDRRHALRSHSNPSLLHGKCIGTRTS